MRSLKKFLYLTVVITLIFVSFVATNKPGVLAPKELQTLTTNYNFTQYKLELPSEPAIKKYNASEIASWINAAVPGMNWDQWCQKLVWYSVYFISGVSEPEMVAYPTASAARYASEIISSDPSTAPAGAIHYWVYPREGHVAVSLGGSLSLMTGTAEALGPGGYLLGNNFGVTTVESYNMQSGNSYVGWSYSNGTNPNIVDLVK